MSHRYRLYPTPTQVGVMAAHCRDARFVWNVALEQANLWRPGRRRLKMGSWDRQLAEARQTFDWLAAGSSSVQQAALRDLRQAFRNWWSRPDHFGRPTWRKAGINEGFVVRDLTVAVLNRRWAELTVPKAGAVRFRLSRPLPAGAKSARVTRDRAGRWHVAIVAPQPAVERSSTGAVVGLDMGVAATVTTSDGRHLSMPKLLSAGETQRLRRLQRRLCRQRKGSNRRERTKVAIARLKARETDRRHDWIEQATTRLVREHDVICVEDLRVRNMVRSAQGTVAEPGRNVRAKAGLNRSIPALAWSLLRARLEQKAAAATSPCVVVAVNPADTSRRCHQCRYTAKENRESQAVFHCKRCGWCDNADVNAAINIREHGLDVLAAAGRAVTRPGGTPHRAQPSQGPDETSTSRVAA